MRVGSPLEGESKGSIRDLYCEWQFRGSTMVYYRCVV